MKTKNMIFALFVCTCLGTVMLVVPLAFPRHKPATCRSSPTVTQCQGQTPDKPARSSVQL